MPLEDLDLEFEDEEDLKRKRSNELVHQDVDIEFGASPEAAPKAATPNAVPKAPSIVASKPSIVPSLGKATATPTANNPKPIPAASPAAAPIAQVKRLDEARAAFKKPAGVPSSPAAASPSTARPMSQGANALDLDLVPEEAGLAQLYAEIEATKFDARVQVAVAEFKTEILSDLLSDVKVLDMQVHQLLVRISQKHPDLKPEAMALKKLLADFTAKKRK